MNPLISGVTERVRHPNKLYSKAMQFLPLVNQPSLRQLKVLIYALGRIFFKLWFSLMFCV